MSELLGRTLGQYRIIERIGEGGMATVYKAYQPGLNRYVALKVLAPIHAKQPGFNERFQREAEAVASLNHPNILPIYDSGQEGGYSYIVMRHIEGAHTLKEVMAEPLDLAQIADLVGQVAAALDCAHRQGVIHRDVKPSNVLMDGNWALLTDFGLARMIETSVKLTGSGVGVGTPAYMSPEQGQGIEIDHRTDIYALGVILFEMLTGQIPHNAETPLAIVLKRMTEPLPLPRTIDPDIPEPVERVVLKALARQPRDRFVSAGEMAKALVQAVGAPAVGEAVESAPAYPGVEVERSPVVEQGLELLPTAEAAPLPVVEEPAVDWPDTPTPVPSRAQEALAPVRQALPRKQAPSVGAPVTVSLPPDQTDDIVLVGVAETEWAVNVDEMAALKLTITNGGNQVAMFEARVLGLKESWVDVSPPQVSLDEGARATARIAIAAPRHPSSEARAYPLVIEVTSPDYPGRASRTGATLTINPYYDFSVGGLSPRQQTVRWSQRTGHAEIPVTNKGNSETTFRLEAEDAEQACSFEFQVPGEEVALIRQAEMRLPPGETYTVPVGITPPRRLVAMRKRFHSYTVTTSMIGGDQIPRSVMGQLKSAPLIGPVMVFLTAISLVALIGFLFSPNLEPQMQCEPRTIDEPGGEVTLAYDASRFPRNKPDNPFNRLNALFLSLTLEHRVQDQEWQELASSGDALERAFGEIAHVPGKNSEYRLTAKTWVSTLLPFLTGKSRVAQVYVTPVAPEIVTFDSDRDLYLAGETVTLYWEVQYAESLVLEYGRIQEDFAGQEVERGQYSLTLDESTSFTLVATNRSSDNEVRMVRQVLVLYPTPAVVRFDVSPRTVTLGENVEIEWEVSGADAVSIDPLGWFPIKGNTSDQPPELRRYKLVAYKNAADGSVVESDSFIKEVIVHTPTPTPAPPEIQVFDATPKQVARGDNQVVNLRWQIVGQTTNVEISAPDLKLTGLNPRNPDGIEVTVNETTLFVLTAHNDELSASALLEVVALSPTPTATPAATRRP
jgi:hypothetical protein